MGLPRTYLALSAVLLMLGGCSADEVPVTRLMLVTDSDVPVENIEQVTFTVSQRNSLPDRKVTSTRAEFGQLPVTLAVAHGGGEALGPVTVTARAVLVDGGSIQRKHVVFFVRGEIRAVPLHLFAECQGVTSCSVGDTCSKGGCTSEEIDTLPPWPAPGLTVDGGVPDAGSADDDADPADSVADTTDDDTADDDTTDDTVADDDVADDDSTDDVPDGDVADDDSTDEDATDDDSTDGVPDGDVADDDSTDDDSTDDDDTRCPGDPDLQTDRNNCGECQKVCPRDAELHLWSLCVQGTCQPLDCETGWTDCNQDRSNGCEADLKTSNDHCGKCNMLCEDKGEGNGAQRTCKEGNCVKP